MFVLSALLQAVIVSIIVIIVLLIPILSNTESLNVAVATGIILYKFREIEGAF